MEELIKNFPPDSTVSDCFVSEDGLAFSTEGFYPTLRISTQEIVYLKWFPHINDFCTPELQIAIPISDILKEVPQYVPKDSILWEFK